MQPVYYTRKGSTVYAIHWGWPAGAFTLAGVRPPKGAKIRLLGGSGDLSWRMEGNQLLIDAPPVKPAGKWAYTLVIEGAAGN